MTIWLEYFVNGLATQMRETVERGKQAMRTDLIVRRHELNERQAKALRFLLDHDEMRLQDLEDLCSKVNRRTLQRDLQKMVKLDIIDRKGAARQVHYALKKSGL